MYVINSQAVLPLYKFALQKLLFFRASELRFYIGHQAFVCTKLNLVFLPSSHHPISQTMIIVVNKLLQSDR